MASAMNEFPEPDDRIPLKNDSGDINTLAPALPSFLKFPEDRPARQRIVKEGLTRIGMQESAGHAQH